MSKKRGDSRTNNKGSVKAVLITVGVIALLFIASLLINSGFLRRAVTVMEIDGVKISGAEYNYLYYGSINEYNQEIYATYQGYASYMLPDNTQPLEGQMKADSGQTWAQFYEDNAMRKMKTFAGAYKEAQSVGFTLTEADYAEVDTQLDELVTQVKDVYDMSFATFLNNQFGSGSGVNKALYKEMSRKQFLVGKYAESVQDSFIYTQEEIDAHYAENKDNYDFYKYRYFVVAADEVLEADFATTEEYEAARAEAVAAARDTANDYAASITSEQGFIDAAREYDSLTYETDKSTVFTSQGSQLTFTFTDWLKDSARRAGDVCSEPMSTDEATNSQFYVAYFAERYNNEYPSVDIQLLSIAPVAPSSSDYTGEDGVLDQEAFDAATEARNRTITVEAQEVYDAWQTNGGTREVLADMVDNHYHENEEDTGTHSISGGLYEHVRRSYDDEDILDEWIHNPARKTGDSTLLEMEDNSGWYVVYFVGQSQNYDDYLAETDLRTTAMTEWEAVFTSKEAVEKWGIRFI